MKHVAQVDVESFAKAKQASPSQRFHQWFIRVSAVFVKEWRDTWKDRRGTQSALMFALLGPVVVLMMLQSSIDTSRDETMPVVALLGGELWPNLSTQLSAKFDVQPEKSSTLALKNLLADKVDLVLTIPEHVDSYLKGGRTIVLDVAVKSARSESQKAASQLRALLQNFNDTAAQMRLVAHGASPTQMQVLSLNVAEHGPSARFQTLTQVMVIMLLMGAFFSGMNVAIDTTAGERERESLEVLLAQSTNPAPLWLGKYLVVLSFALIGGALTVALLWLGLSQLALYELPLKLNLSWNTWLQIWLAMLPFAALMSALQMVFALLARNYKEAQIYLTLLAFLPGILTLPFAAKLPEGLPIPVVQETLWLQTLLRGGELPCLPWCTLLAVVIAAVTALMFASARALRNERMLAAS